MNAGPASAPLLNVATKPVVAVRDLTVRFGRGETVIRAVDGISFTLARGEVMTVIGESGSGKSVMLRTLLGLNPSYAKIGGSVVVEDHDIGALSREALSRLRGRIISMVFQEPATALDPVFTIGKQISETIVRHEGVSEIDARRRAKELLDLVAIPSAERRLGSYPHELSGGMRQRAMIALALSCRPSVLLADEPTTALDATVQIQLLLLLRQLQRELGMAVIFVTHDMGVAAEISDRVAVMYAGRFVETGSVEDVLLSPQHPYTQGLIRSTLHGGMRGKPLETIPGSPPDLSAPRIGCSFAPRCRHADDICRSDDPREAPLGPLRTVACRRVGEISASRSTVSKAPTIATTPATVNVGRD
jgi:peptide/nickel transport system ATP-binding protein